MDYPAPPHFPGFPPSEDQPDGLLAELHEVQAALAVAEYHIRLWRSNTATGNRQFRAYRAYAAHEALDEAGRVIDCIAETLLIDAAGTLTPHLGHPAQIVTEVSPTDAARREPACSGDHTTRREWVTIVQHFDPAGTE